MDHSEEDFSAFLSRRKKERQSQVRELSEKLLSWRDESHRQISDIISSHNTSIDKGYNDLVEEVFNLQNQVSVLQKEQNVLLDIIKNSKLNNDFAQEVKDLKAEISNLKKERIVLLDTVHILNGDRRQVDAKIHLTEPEVQEEVDSSDIIDIKEESVETPKIHNETTDEGECSNAQTMKIFWT